MLLSHEARDGVAVLCVHGPVEDADVAHLQHALDVAVAQGPRGVLVDLGQAGALAPAAVDVLNWATARAQGWPRPSLSVCCGSPELGELLLPEVRMHACRDDALAHVDDRDEDHVCVRTTVEATAAGLAQAREKARACAAEHGMTGDDVSLVVSELVTNAVRYGAPPIELEIDTCDHCITVVVADSAPERPVTREAAVDDEGGRGLLLVDALACDSGVRSGAAGKAVWAELPLHRA